MRKLFLLVLILGILTWAGTAIADLKPRAILGNGEIFLVYDLETGALCYITSMGGIHCTHQGNLAISGTMGKTIRKEVKKYQERKNTFPHMVPLNQDHEPTPKKKDPKKKDDSKL
jgi:hypothetical protein